MSIFGTVKKTENDVNIQESAAIQPTTESLAMIMTESAKESYQLRAAMYVSDILMEQAVVTEGAQPEVLMEAFLGDFFKKVKQVWESLKKKLREWFDKVKRFFALMFESGEKFVKTFENEIRQKSVKGFKYTGYKYTVDKMDSISEKISSKVAEMLVPYFNGIDDLDEIVKSDSHYKALDKKNYDGAKYDAAEEKEALIKSTGYDSIQELQEELQKAGRNGETSPEEIENFSANNKDEMMTFIKGKNKAIEFINKCDKSAAEKVEKVIKAMEKAAGKFKDEKQASVTTYVSHATEMIRYGITIGSSINSVNVAMIKEMAREFESTLKAFLRWKPAKEGFEPETDGATSVLESAMRVI